MRQSYLEDTQEVTLELQSAVNQVADELGIPQMGKALNGRHIVVGRKLDESSARLIAEVETAIANGCEPHQIKGMLLSSDLGL